jgi:hypothetical protein
MWVALSTVPLAREIQPSNCICLTTVSRREWVSVPHANESTARASVGVRRATCWRR